MKLPESPHQKTTLRTPRTAPAILLLAAMVLAGCSEVRNRVSNILDHFAIPDTPNWTLRTTPDGNTVAVHEANNGIKVEVADVSKEDCKLPTCGNLLIQKDVPYLHGMYQNITFRQGEGFYLEVGSSTSRSVGCSREGDKFLCTLNDVSTHIGGSELGFATNGYDANRPPINFDSNKEREAIPLEDGEEIIAQLGKKAEEILEQTGLRQGSKHPPHTAGHINLNPQ